VTSLSVHTHAHDAVEPPPGPSEGAVFVDVGDGVGAAVIFTEPDLRDAELEIRPALGEWRGLHTAVRERRLGDGVQHAAVFGSLPEGTWELRVRGNPDGRPVLAIRVPAGSVVEAAWPRARS
jgi:hypothetical protein